LAVFDSAVIGNSGSVAFPKLDHLLPYAARRSVMTGPILVGFMNFDGDDDVMKVKLTTKQKRDRRWKIKRRKLRRQKTGV
jgi:hypothetical protein